MVEQICLPSSYAACLVPQQRRDVVELLQDELLRLLGSERAAMWVREHERVSSQIPRELRHASLRASG